MASGLLLTYENLQRLQGDITDGGDPQKGVTSMRDFMIRIAARIRSREEGQAMVEYALILGLVSVVSIIALTAIGTNVNAIFDNIQTTLAGAL